MFKLSSSSKKKLEKVHPKLVEVAELALSKSKYDFGISEGARDVETQKKYVDEGKSQTMNSKHLIQDDGYSHALDFFVLVNGSITWNIKYYRPVMQAFIYAAVELGVPVRFGGLWESFVDGPHVELKL